MYCRKCGKSLLDDSSFCSYCGEKVILVEEKKEKQKRIIINEEDKYINNKSEKIKKNYGDKVKAPEWNLDGFPKIKEEGETENRKDKVEKIRVDWNDFSKNMKKNTLSIEKKDIEESIEKETKNEKEDLFKTKFIEKEKINAVSKQAVLEEEIFGKDNSDEPEIDRNTTEKQIDKFYTFSKKNEDFQKLLDQEYEKMKKQEDDEATSYIEKTEKVKPLKENKISSVMSQSNKEDNTIFEKSENFIKNSIIENDEHNKEEVIENNANDDEEKTEENLVDSGTDSEINMKPFEEGEAIEFEKEENKISIVNILIIIITIAILLELAIVGMKYFFPQSNAVKKIDQTLGVAERKIEKLIFKKNDDDKDSKKKIEKNKISPKNQEVIEKKDPNSNEEILKELNEVNQNIEKISINDELKFDESKKYEEFRIEDLKAVDNDVWKTDENNQNLYYKKELAKLITKFDSSWIGYVNEKEMEVFQYMKKNSPIYNDSKNFSKVGKIKETFLNVEIGEIKRDENGFYIVVREKIKWENKKDEIKILDWIYYIEENNDKLELVKYIKF